MKKIRQESGPVVLAAPWRVGSFVRGGQITRRDLDHRVNIQNEKKRKKKRERKYIQSKERLSEKEKREKKRLSHIYCVHEKTITASRPLQ